jgi:LmbE family N-acetylglucosaminyl deacetylase
MPDTLLVIAAHPDDEVLGCGGTVARLVSEGNLVHAIILGQGAVSRGECHAPACTALKQAAVNAAATIGAQTPLFLDLPDNRFDALELLDVVQEIEKVIRDLKPTRILTHHAHDLNIDHSITFQATLTAARPMQGSSVREILCFETPSSTEWSFGKLGPQFTPSVFYDVTDHFNTKIQALEHYSMEMRDFPHPRSYKAIRAMAEKWGSVGGYWLCEAFEVVFSCR